MKFISGNPFLKKANGKVFIDSIPLEEILEKFEPPFMILLENRIIENLNNFKDVFNSVFSSKKFQLFYSLKANFLPEICEIVGANDIGAEIVGLPELKLALNVGFPPNKIIIGGPYLSKDLIKASIKAGVKEIIVYNLNDLYTINSIAQKFDFIQNICLRVNSQKYESKLGIIFDKNNLIKLKKIISENHNIKITTILSHYTSQMNSFEQYKKNISTIAENLNKLSKIDIICENINLGGGFPEATIMKKEQLENIAIKIKNTIEELGIDYKHIFFEPGRYFIGDAGIYIAKIIKVSKNRWIFLNIGNHICPKFARCSLRFNNVSQINEPHKYKTSFAGNLPTDQDVLAKNYFFTEKLKEGDVILVSNVGAYTLTFSNRFPYQLPNIFLVSNENIKQVFNPFTNHDFSITL